MWINNRFYFSTTVFGKLIETVIAIIFLIIFSPLIIIYVLGWYCGKIIDQTAKLEDWIIIKLLR